MKRQTQKIIMTLVIIGLLAMSTIAFVVVSSLPIQPQSEDIPNPTQFVIDGYVNESLKQVYLSRGYTLMEYHYYEGCCKDIGPYIDFLPEVIGNQLIMQKILDSEYYVNIESLYGKEDNITPETNRELLVPLCSVLVKAPIECGLINIDETARQNTTNNDTDKIGNQTTNQTNATIDNSSIAENTSI